MNNQRHGIITILLAALSCGSGVLLAQPPLLQPQIFSSDPFRISVEGPESEACDPRAGDDVNMRRCSLKVRVVRAGAEPATVLLPWETVSLKGAIAIDKGAILFMGSTQAGFSEMSVYDEKTRAIVHKQLAQRASISPSHNLVAYQTYQPPHGSQTPQVQIELVSTRNLDFGRGWETRMIFDTSSGTTADTGSRERGNSLCTSNLFWSKGERWVGLCILNNESDSERLVLAPTHPGADAALFKEVDHKAICRATNQNPNERCTVFIERMGISASKVDVQLRSVGSNGYKEEQLSYPIESFGKYGK